VASGFIAGTPFVDKTLSCTITKTVLFLGWKKPSSWLVGKKTLGLDTSQNNSIFRLERTQQMVGWKKTLGLDTSQIVVITLFAKVEISEHRNHHNFVRRTNIFLNF